MKVRALKLGYYQHKRRREGDVFTLVPVKAVDKDGKSYVVPPEKQFSNRWMELYSKKVEVAPEVSAEESESEDSEVI